MDSSFNNKQQDTSSNLLNNVNWNELCDSTLPNGYLDLDTSINCSIEDGLEYNPLDITNDEVLDFDNENAIIQNSTNKKIQFLFKEDQSVLINDPIALLDNNDYILIQHNAIVVDSENNILFSSFAEHRKVKTGVIKNLIKNSYHGCCIAFKKELIKEILPIPDNIYLHDEWIGLVGELNGKTCFIDDKLIKYRRHSENTSSFKHLPILSMLMNRLQYTKELIKYIINKRKNRREDGGTIQKN